MNRRLIFIAIVAGDLNARPSSAEMSKALGFLTDSFQPNAGGDFTAPAINPTKRIDYILRGNDPRLHVASDSFRIIHATDPSKEPSDHLPVYAEFELSIQPNGTDVAQCLPILYVDKTGVGLELGLPAYPYHTVRKAVSAASPGTILAIRAGTYLEPQIIDARITSCVYGGTVRIR